MTTATGPLDELGVLAALDGLAADRQRPGLDDRLLRRTLAAQPLLASNTAQLYRTRGGARLAGQGIRQLRQERRRELGAAPAVVDLDGCYGVSPLAELLALVGAPLRESVPPTATRCAGAPTAHLTSYLHVSGVVARCVPEDE